MDQEILGVTLGREELLVLLRVLHSQTLPGIEENPFTGMSEDQAAAALASAERSLRARGLLKVLEDEKRIEVDPLTMALVGTCLNPKYTVMVTSRARNEKQTTWFYHFTDHLGVEHSSPEVGLYQLIGVAESRDMLPRIIESIHLPKMESHPYPSALIRETVLVQVRDEMSSGKIESARSLLRGEGVADMPANVFISDLNDPFLNASFIRMEYSQSKPEPVNGFSILRGTNGLWAMTPEGDDGGKDLKIKIDSVSKQDLMNRVSSLLAA